MDSMTLSAVQAAGNTGAGGVQGSVATTVLKQSLDLERQVMAQLLNGIAASADTGTVASPPTVGSLVDVTA